MTHGLQALLRVGRNTADLGRTLAFYRDALGFRAEGITDQPPAWARLPGVNAAPARCARLSLGAQQIELSEFPDAAPYPPGSSACDLAFQHCAIVVADMRAAYERVMAHGARAISQGGPQTLPPATGSVAAFKFRDPDGHPLELIQFPPGTGDPAWQPHGSRAANLGIDHSAISIGDHQRSVLFYGLLGLRVFARGVNRGIEQQRLDDLADVEVEVIAMQTDGSRTPHLELLGYRTPRGRPASLSSVTAIVADRVVWQAKAIEVLLEAMSDAGFGDALLACDRVDGATVALLRDPDGHLLVLSDEGT